MRQTTCPTCHLTPTQSGTCFLPHTVQSPRSNHATHLVVLVLPVDVIPLHDEFDERPLDASAFQLDRLHLLPLQPGVLVVGPVQFAQTNEEGLSQVERRVRVHGGDVAELDLHGLGDHGVVREKLEAVDAAARVQLENEFLKGFHRKTLI